MSVAQAFLAAERRRHEVLRSLAAVMASRQVPGGATAVMALLMAASQGELRAALLKSCSSNGSYSITTLEDAGLLEEVAGSMRALDRRMRRLRLTAVGQLVAAELEGALERELAGRQHSGFGWPMTKAMTDDGL